MKLNIIYEDSDVLVIDKPAGIVVFSEDSAEQESVINLLLKDCPYLAKTGSPPRYGIIHRLDKDTSGVLLIAKTNEALIFFQRQFKNRETEKKYIALAVGNMKDRHGAIDTLIGRAEKNRLRQKVYLPCEPGAKNKRQAITEYRILENFEGYTLLEVTPKTGRKHQIRCHLNYIGHPIAGDRLYEFKNQPKPANLERQFLHAASLKITLPCGEIKEFLSPLPEDLNMTLQKLKNDLL